MALITKRSRQTVTVEITTGTGGIPEGVHPARVAGVCVFDNISQKDLLTYKPPVKKGDRTTMFKLVYQVKVGEGAEAQFHYCSSDQYSPKFIYGNLPSKAGKLIQDMFDFTESQAKQAVAENTSNGSFEFSILLDQNVMLTFEKAGEYVDIVKVRPSTIEVRELQPLPDFLVAYKKADGTLYQENISIFLADDLLDNEEISNKILDAQELSWTPAFRASAQDSDAVDLLTK